MFKLVLVIFLFNFEEGKWEQKRKEYHFTKVGECEDMVETLRGATPNHSDTNANAQFKRG